MKYISTRGGITPIPFKKAVMMGLASDGGLIVPESIPYLNPKNFRRGISYTELAVEILKLFIDDIPEYDIANMIQRSYSTFDTPDVAPLVRKNGIFLLELFHGPTLAFKDIALQFLGNLFEYILSETGENLNVLGATSGDTGSAAIHGLRGRKGINIFILHPHGGVSSIQELQMTTVTDPNVFNIAIKGTFDDCQKIIKEIFSDVGFKEKYKLGSVNSINFARILAQIVYYFYGYIQSNKSEVAFSVPTGNFGDIFAGYLAKRMGLPIQKLILATNKNDILTRFVRQGDYSIRGVVRTLAPSMDIQIASNLERYVYYLYNCNSTLTKNTFEAFLKTGKTQFNKDILKKIQEDFISFSASEEDILSTIRKFYKNTGCMIDPHTACGVNAANLSGLQEPICLATAHPAKFPEAVKAATGIYPREPESIKNLKNREKRFILMPSSTKKVKDFIVANLSQSKA